ncbi:hypothetical protein D3M70_27345 [Pseudomonas sp. LS-2]|nr:hypothetical protein D3M70_27345 [Pseudomonas sp. LS-2]
MTTMSNNTLVSAIHFPRPATDNPIAVEIIDAILRHKKNGGKNHGGFSVVTKFADCEYHVECCFDQDIRKKIIYENGSHAEIVESIYDLSNVAEIARIADLIMLKGWAT